MKQNYDSEQFRRDCWEILCKFGERKPLGFYTIQEYECGPFLITTRKGNNLHPKGMGIYLNGAEIKTIRMGTDLADHILKMIIRIEER